MTRPFRYGVIGAGRQGCAAAFWLAVRDAPDRVLVLDSHIDIASRAAERVNQLTGRDVASPLDGDAGDTRQLIETLAEVDVAVCAVPYSMILGCTRAAIEAGTSMVDLGGHTETVLRQLEMDNAAKTAGVTIVPDCGMGPGMGNTMGLAALERLDLDAATPRELRLWEGGIPIDPPPPWGYVASFNIEGLTNEYDGQAVFLRDGRVTKIDALTELEHVTFDGIGILEAFVTSGGTSTLPYALEGKLEIFENKTCRYPGHFERFRAFRDLGLFSEEPLVIDGGWVRPRDLYHALLEPQIHADQVDDLCVIRARATGDKNGTGIAVTLDLVDRHDPETGFSAMERITGGHAALIAILLAQGAIPTGVRTLDKTVSALALLDEARAWGFAITERVDHDTNPPTG